MSYDVGMGCSHCGSSVLSQNMTSNLAKMWDAAGCPLRDMDGWTGVQVLPKVQQAIDRLKRDPEDFEPMQPDNGWGTYRQCIEFLEKIRDACARFPYETISVGH